MLEVLEEESGFRVFKIIKAHFKSGMISFISIAPAMTSEVIIVITR